MVFPFIVHVPGHLYWVVPMFQGSSNGSKAGSSSSGWTGLGTPWNHWKWCLHFRCLNQDLSLAFLSYIYIYIHIYIFVYISMYPCIPYPSLLMISPALLRRMPVFWAKNRHPKKRWILGLCREWLDFSSQTGRQVRVSRFLQHIPSGKLT
jgi:hypothetical protein